MSNRRPNIVFIMTDQQRYDTFTHVNKKIITPNLDKLIDDSIFFKNAYCSNPSCIPSRAAIVTGKYPTQCQCPTYITQLPAHEVTYMNRLRDVGYHTAVVGKQHFAGSPINRGYDEEWIIDGHSPSAQEVDLYVEYLKKEGVYGTPYSDGSLIIGGQWLWDMKYHIDSYVAKLGMDWLRDRTDGDKVTEEEKPWYFTLSFPGPHMPYDCEGTKYSDLYDLDNLGDSETTYEDLKTKPPHFLKMKEVKLTKNHTPEKFKKTKRAYYANMTLIDEKVGEVIELLKAKGLYDNTLIIYSADHGDYMGDFECVAKAQYLSEALMRVPLFIKPPIKGFKGYDSEDQVLNIDIAATCLEVAGGSLGKDMSDYSYVDYWKSDREPRIRDHIYMEAGGMKSIIKDGIKVVHYMDRAYGEIYDLNVDPVEKYNLWDKAEWQEHKNNARALIVDQMIRMTPKWDIAWNVNAPTL